MFKCKDCKELIELKDGMKRKVMICHSCGTKRSRREGKIFHDSRRSGARNMTRAYPMVKE